MTLIKICGITNRQDALLAAAAGVDMLGFVFYPPSPRSVQPEQARHIVQDIRRRHPPIQIAGVFVDEALDHIQRVGHNCRLDYIQLHGEEHPEMAAALLDGGFQVIKGFRVGKGQSHCELERYPATAYLLDTYIPGLPGGTGQTFDWALAAQTSWSRPIILAGGLNPGNVAQAIRTARPWGVDVSSGVEMTPGRKDPNLVRRFVTAVKEQDASAPPPP